MDIALAESLNAIWEDAKSAIQDLTKIYDNLNILTTHELSEKTADIALNQNITIYDSLYIAATKKLNATLYTADRKLHNTSKKITVSKLLKL